MLALVTISVTVIVVAILILKKRKPQKTIYAINFTVNDRKGLPAKKFFNVNYVHNKDVIPVKNRALIRNCVI